MKRSKFTDEQILAIVKEGEAAGRCPARVARLRHHRANVPPLDGGATFYLWKSKCAHLGVSELRRLRSVEEDNSRLK